ncbi:hypothetical protein SOASR030_28650 [Leminorella grimontii]|uniref:Inner membrane protein n=1 Tax=Leminorella grimontii TaxID=82981 RepID=A0AAV5N7A5_9GAMM|nr:hypothetical protein [Leminorella grimontii]KFC92869.1 hypothetical protein GLGR_3565 [Leminorella grimontii ATCC 33999 = DSM 5078]GKX56753.1 hypothetical protein SOASR030_28650 [Leminorella grimontii]VFS62227.1 Uncharacterised protein [Leminorella grimontii]
MSWPIPDFFVIKKPSEIRYWVWGSVYILLSFLSCFFLWFFLKENADNYIIYISVLVGIALALGISLGVRIFIYDNNLMRYTAWEQQRQEAKREWSRWATKRVAVIASEVITPKIHLDKILASDEKENLFIEEGKALPLLLISELGLKSRYEQALEWLLFSLREKLNVAMERNSLDVYFLAEEKHSEPLRHSMVNSWKLTGLKERYRLHILTNPISCNDLIDSVLASERNTTPLLVISCQFSLLVTEFISAIFLCGELCAKDMGIVPIAYVERPMPTDESNIGTDIGIMKFYGQLSSETPPLLLFNQVSGDAQAQGISALCRLNNNHEMNSTMIIDSILGKTGNLSEWLCLGLGTNLVYSLGKPNILITGCCDGSLSVISIIQEEKTES